MNFSYYIARRYTVSFSKSTAINTITAIASIGIVVSAMALFVVLSVFSGLREFSLSFTNNTDPDLKIFPKKGKSIVFTESEINKLNHSNNIASYSKIIEERMLFSFNEKQEVAYLKGVDANFTKVNPIKQKLYTGTWITPNTSQVVVGYGIANKLSMGLFDFNNFLEAFAPKPGKGTIDNPNEAFNQSALTPIGIYAINDDLDKKFVYADLGLAQELLQYKPNEVSAFEIKTKDPEAESETIEDLKSIFGERITIKTRAELNDSLHKMLNTENMAIYLIFTLVIIVALFNLIGALIMMILDKKANLKTLFNLGAEIKDLRKIFLTQGSLLTLIGGLAGLLLGIGFVIVQEQFAIIMITPSMPYPIEFRILNVIIVLGTISALGFLASWIASNRVNKNLLD